MGQTFWLWVQHLRLQLLAKWSCHSLLRLPILQGWRSCQYQAWLEDNCSRQHYLPHNPNCCLLSWMLCLQEQQGGKCLSKMEGSSIVRSRYLMTLTLLNLALSWCFSFIFGQMLFFRSFINQLLLLCSMLICIIF